MVRQNLAERNQLPANIIIPADKEALVQLDNASHETIKLYSDDPAHNGKVGMAAVLMNRAKQTGCSNSVWVPRSNIRYQKLRW